jgi:hypothetical protein
MLHRSNYKILFSKILVCAMLLSFNGIAQAHDGKGAIPVKANPPVSVYQALMIGVALGYGGYLLWRARKRSRAGENIENRS